MKKWYTLLWLPLVLLFISGFFFLDRGIESGHSIPGELPTVTVSEDDIMAIRLNHEATRFKVKQLKQLTDYNHASSAGIKTIYGSMPCLIKQNNG